VTNLSFPVDPATLTSLPILTVYGGSEFLDNTPPDVKWVIPGLLPLGIPSLLASQPGLGKSYLMTQLCVALAAGKPFLDYDLVPPCAACYFGLEDGKDMFHRRVRNIIDHYRWLGDWTAENEANFRRHFTAPFINWKSEGASSFLPDLMPNLELILTMYAERGCAPGVMIIDTLARVCDGDENTVQGMRPVLNACSRLAEYGHTPIMLHHVGKGQDGARNAKDKPTLADRMSTEWIRGSGSIVGNFRCTMQFAKITEDEASGAGLDPDMAHQGQILIFGTTKFNNGPKGDWRVIVQDEGGRWSVSPDSAEMLARFRGTKAVIAFTRQMNLLKDLHEARFAPEVNLSALASKYWPESIPIKANTALRQAICRLRHADLIQKKSYVLTQKGLEKITVTATVTGWSDDDA